MPRSDFADPTVAMSPTGVPNVRVAVQSLGDGFAVDLRSPDYSTSREILTRVCKVTGRCDGK